MYVLFALTALSGFIISLIFLIIKVIKKQPKKPFVIALSIFFVLSAAALFLMIFFASEANTSSGTETTASIASETILPTGIPDKVPSSLPTMSPEATAVPMDIPISTLDITACPTDVPTAEPEPTVPPVSDEQLDEGYLDAWFDDSVMVGDSIAGGLNMYAEKERDNNRPCLGNMRIVGVSGLTLHHALQGEKKETTGRVLFRSRFMTISDVVELTQAKRLFLMMGVRDLEYYSADKAVEVYGEIISIVKANHPDLRIYVHSLMPTLKSFAMTVDLDYETNKEANEKLRAFCEEQGYTYIELADLVRDEDGYLKYEYSGPDYSFHPNDLAKEIWVKLLRSVARDEYYAGIWNPEEEND